VIKSMRDCQKLGCWHRLSPSFSPDSLINTMCVTGIGAQYDQDGYTK
jgi:hypothetical protein